MTENEIKEGILTAKEEIEAVILHTSQGGEFQYSLFIQAQDTIKRLESYLEDIAEISVYVDVQGVEVLFIMQGKPIIDYLAKRHNRDKEAAIYLSKFEIKD